MKINPREIEFTQFFAHSKFLHNLIILLTNNSLSLLRALRFSRKKGNGILIISLHLLGDSVYTIPAIRHLRRDYPNEPLHILCYSTGAKIYRDIFKDIDIHTVTESQFIYSRFAKSSVRRLVKQINPNLISDITGTVNSATSIFLSSSKLTGMNLRYYRKIYDFFTPIRTSPHLMDMYLDPVRLILKSSIDKKLFEFECTTVGIKKILIFPFAGWKAKEWEFNNFVEVAKWLRSDFRVEFIAEPNQLSAGMKEEIENLGFDINYSSSLDELFELIKGCSLFISNDSGPVHIAQALGKLTFIVYGPSNPEYSIPYGDKFGYVRRVISCSPIETQFCNTLGGRKCPTIECMRDLSAEKVKEGLKTFLNRFTITYREQ